MDLSQPGAKQAAGGPPQQTGGQWLEYTHQDRRKYYYHTVTKQTVWTKPQELKGPKELELEASSWKAYTTPEGKKYYHNTATSQTVWTVPPEYKTLLDEYANEVKLKEAAAAAQKVITPTTPNSSLALTSSPHHLRSPPERQQHPPILQNPPSAMAAAAAVAAGSVSGMKMSQIAQSSDHNLQNQQPPPRMGRNVPFIPALPHPGHQPPPMGARIPFQQQPHQPQLPTRFNPQTSAPLLQPTSSFTNSHFSQPASSLSSLPISSSSSASVSSSLSSSVHASTALNHHLNHTISNTNTNRNYVNQTPEFATKELAEEAFMKMLKDTKVTSTWTWEQTMRAVVTNPMYHSLKTTAERKAAFQVYIDNCRIQERQDEIKKAAQMEADFKALLNQKEKENVVTASSRYTTISRMLAQEPAFLAFAEDRQRFLIFDHYVDELSRKEKERQKLKRKEGVIQYMAMLKDMPEITYMTKWADAQEMFKERPEFSDRKENKEVKEGEEEDEQSAIKSLAKIDLLTNYEDHIKTLERVVDHKRSRDRVLRKRAERKRREVFKAWLMELRQQGKIHAKTNWMELFPILKDDPRYLESIGQSGSTPMELFWDLIEDLDEKLYQDRKMIQDLMKSMDYEVVPETTPEEFTTRLQTQPRAAQLPAADLSLIYHQLLAKAIHHAKEEKRRQERIARKKAEAFRYLLKHLSPPVTVTSTWDQTKPLVEAHPDYASTVASTTTSSTENDEEFQEIFERYIVTLKEKASRNQGSDDEDGSIMEDDADFRGNSKSSFSTSGASRSTMGHGHHHSISSSGSIVNKPNVLKRPLEGQEPALTTVSAASSINSNNAANEAEDSKEKVKDNKDAPVVAVQNKEQITEQLVKKQKLSTDGNGGDSSAEEGEVVETPAVIVPPTAAALEQPSSSSQSQPAASS